MPTYQDDVSRITSARQRQGALNAEAGQITAGANTFGDRVMESVRAARAQRGTSELQRGVGTATGQLVSDPQRIYDYAGADVRPSTVDRFTSAARASNLSTLATADQFNADIGQTMEDAIGAGTNKLLAQAALKKAESEKAKQEADSLIEEIKLQMEQAKSKVGGKTYSYTLPNGQLLDDLTASQYEEIYSKYEGKGKVDLKTTQQKDVNFFKDIYKAAQDIESNRQDEFTGLANFLQGSYRGAMGTQSQSESNMRSAISAHNTAIRNKISGTAVSAEEIKALKDMLISATESDTTVKNKINRAKDYALKGTGSILSSAGYDVDPMEYLMQDKQIGEKQTRPPLSSFDK